MKLKDDIYWWRHEYEEKATKSMDLRTFIRTGLRISIVSRSIRNAESAIVELNPAMYFVICCI